MTTPTPAIKAAAAPVSTGIAGDAPFVPPGYANETEWLRQQLKDLKTCIKAHKIVIDDLTAERAAPCAVVPAQPTQPHADDIAVDKFAAAMKVKMAASRAKGRGGWEDPAQCSIDRLAQMMVEHVSKGDPVDIGNFAMMLHHYQQRDMEEHPCAGKSTVWAIQKAAKFAAQPQQIEVAAPAAPVAPDLASLRDDEPICAKCKAIGAAYKIGRESGSARCDAVMWSDAVLLAGIQAICISADQEWRRQDGALSEFDTGWFMGQLITFDMYTSVEKSAIAEAREYIGKLSNAAHKDPAETGNTK